MPTTDPQPGTLLYDVALAVRKLRGITFALRHGITMLAQDVGNQSVIAVETSTNLIDRLDKLTVFTNSLANLLDEHLPAPTPMNPDNLPAELIDIVQDNTPDE